jgi:hypothetical protein
MPYYKMSAKVDGQAGIRQVLVKHPGPSEVAHADAVKMLKVRIAEQVSEEALDGALPIMQGEHVKQPTVEIRTDIKELTLDYLFGFGEA